VANDADRTQPEFSLGERLARVEAEQRSSESTERIFWEQMDRRLLDARDLFEEKLEGLRREVVAKADAQKEAVDKAEEATGRQFTTFVEQNDRKADTTNKRLQALESGDAGRQEVSNYKASSVAVIVALTGLLLLLFHFLPK
jgi:hypothetical protein